MASKSFLMNGHIHVLGQSSGHRVHGIDVQKNREVAYDAVGDAGGVECRGKSLRDIEDLVHCVLEYSVGEHGLYLKILAPILRLRMRAIVHSHQIR
jgi:hypothetical protein